MAFVLSCLAIRWIKPCVRSRLPFSAVRFVAYNYRISDRGLILWKKIFVNTATQLCRMKKNSLRSIGIGAENILYLSAFRQESALNVVRDIFSAKSVGEMQREMTEVEQTTNLVSVPIIALQPAK